MRLSALLPLLSAALSAATQPNIIFFLTDDQDVEMGSLAYMPQVRANLVEKGATFTRMYAHVPVCCPSRSSLISGQYMHNNGCRGNGISTNCSSRFFQNTSETRSYVTDLQNAGYRTSFAGKYVRLRLAFLPPDGAAAAPLFYYTHAARPLSPAPSPSPRRRRLARARCPVEHVR